MLQYVQVQIHINPCIFSRAQSEGDADGECEAPSGGEDDYNVLGTVTSSTHAIINKITVISEELGPFEAA